MEIIEKLTWRDALRGLEVGDFFVANKADRANVSTQMSGVKRTEGLWFIARTISEDLFACIRVDDSTTLKEIDEIAEKAKKMYLK